jgi:hypothetical protein
MDGSDGAVVAAIAPADIAANITIKMKRMIPLP